MVKAVLSGRGDELVDLAKTNLALTKSSAHPDRVDTSS
jgi:hypothetical protein